VVLISDPGQNAYSFPDGAIYIHTGLLSHLESEAELALLLSHELAHVTRRHALRALAAGPAETDETIFDRTLSDSLAWFHELTAQKEFAQPYAARASLRRSLEQEADRVGLDMVIKAGYDPHEAIEIFEHLRECNAIAADPSLPEPYKAIGLIHLKKGRARSARGFFESALALAPHAHDNDYIRSYLTQCITTIEGEDL
jgi:predicted Zn-dependent protease